MTHTQHKVMTGVALCLLALQIFSSCAHETAKVRQDVVKDSSGNTVTVQKEQVVTTTEEKHTSVLGTVFDVVGEVIALPFRLVAGIFRFIF